MELFLYPLAIIITCVLVIRHTVEMLEYMTIVMLFLAGKLKCQIQRDGRVHIEGVMTDVGLLKDSLTVYQMKVQQLCPPGPFTICFNLPGPVDPRLFSPNFRPDGILEMVVMKHRIH